MYRRVMVVASGTKRSCFLLKVYLVQFDFLNSEQS